MSKIILAFFIGAGITTTIWSIIEKEEQKKRDAWEKWRAKLP